MGIHAQWYRFFYSIGREDWIAMKDSSQESFTGLTIPHFASGVQLWVSFIPLNWETV